MKVTLTLTLILTSASILLAEDADWRAGKLAYRKAVCKYEEKCNEYCAKNPPLPCECETESNEKVLTQFTKFMMSLYDLKAGDKDLCKYEKKCYQYGYCPSCRCEAKAAVKTLKNLVERGLPEKEKLAVLILLQSKVLTEQEEQVVSALLRFNVLTEQEELAMSILLQSNILTEQEKLAISELIDFMEREDFKEEL